MSYPRRVETRREGMGLGLSLGIAGASLGGMTEFPSVLANAPAHPGRLTGGKDLDSANPLGDLVARVRNARSLSGVFAQSCGLIHASKAAKRAARDAVTVESFTLAQDLVAVATWLRGEIDAME